MKNEQKFVAQLLERLKDQGSVLVDRSLLKDFSVQSYQNVKSILLKLERQGDIGFVNREGEEEDPIRGLPLMIVKRPK